VGGSGPYREAGTTLASAILSAKNIHNHLVPLTLSRGTRVVVTRQPLLDIVLRREACRFFLYPKRERRIIQKKIFRCLRFFISFFVLPCFELSQLPTTFLGSFDAWENFRNFARPFKASTRAKKRSSVYISWSRREREIKDGDFTSFRASLLFVDRRFCINRNLSLPKTKSL